MRLEQRQQEADAARGRSEDDQCKPRDKDGKPKGGRYKRDFGVPKDSAQESFTNTDSRIMKRAGGGYDYSYNAYTALDETAQIVVVAELTNNATDNDRLPVLLAQVKATLGNDAKRVLADAGFRSEVNSVTQIQLDMLPLEYSITGKHSLPAQSVHKTDRRRSTRRHTPWSFIMFKRFLTAVLAFSASIAFASVDVNVASVADLDSIKGIGPGTSTKIVDARKSAKFKDWNDFIARVPGIGDKRAIKLSEEGLTVNGQEFKSTSKPTSAASTPTKPAAKVEAKPAQ